MSAHDDRPALLAVSALQARGIDWLWPAWLALGKLAILDGDPGLGKSLLALDCCARLSTGRTFPDGGSGPPPGSSIVLNGEDGGEDTVKPRLAALGADLDRVFVLQPPLESGSPLFFPSAVEQLDAAVLHVGARLVVIDSVMAFLDPGIAASSDQGVRRALLPLARLAERRRCAILLIRHLNKSARASALYRGGGSIGLIGACRSGCLVAPDPTDPRRRVLAQVKNNLGPKQASLGYDLVASGQGSPTVRWLGPSPWSADELLARQPSPGRLRPRIRAREFLRDFLKAGPRTSRDIWSAALLQHLSERTLRRARDELGISTRRAWAGGQRVCYWRLPGQPDQAGTTATASPPSAEDDSGDLEPWLGPCATDTPS